MPIYSDVIARLDERAVKSVISEMESQFKDGGANVGDVFSKAFSAATKDFGAGLSDGLRSVIGDMGSLGSVAESALGGMSMKAAAAATGIGLIAVAAVEAGQALFDAGARWDEVTDRMSARTNMLGDQMDQLSDTLRQAFRDSPSSLEEVANTLTGVTQSLHLTGQAAVDVTGQLDYLNRAAGQNVDIRSLSQALAAFGVDAGKAGDSLDMLYVVSAKTGIPINELTANLRNAAPAAQTLGLTLGELTNLFGKFEEGGINGSRAQMALNNAAKVFADANIPLKTGLADTVTQIHGFIDAGNEAAAVDLAGKVFGERGAEQFVNLIRQGKLTVGELKTELSGTEGAIDKNKDATEGMAEQWDILKNKVTDLKSYIGNDLYQAIDKAAGRMLEWVNSGLDNGGIMMPLVGPMSGGNNDPLTFPGGLGGGANASRERRGLPIPGDGHTPQDINQAIEDAKKNGSGTLSAPAIPFPAGYGAPPAPGETVQQWQHRMQIMDAQHTIAEKQAALTQLESDNTADQNAVIKARNDVIQANMRRYADALATHASALALQERSGNAQGVAESQGNMANVLLAMGDTARAMERLRTAARYFREHEMKRELAIQLNNMAGVLFQRHQLDSAETLYREALDMRTSVSEKKAIASTLNGLAGVLLARGKSPEARSLLHRALALSSEVGARNERMQTLLGLARLHAGTQPGDSAFWYHEHYSAVRDSLFNEDMGRQLAEMDARYGSERKEREIQRQRADLAALSAHSERRKFWLALVGGFAGMVLLISLLVLQVQRRRAREARDAAVIAERERGLRDLVESTEAERQRIAAELHDGVGQQISGLRFRLEDAAARDASLSDLLAIADDASKEVRGLAHQMMPRALASQGLVPAMEDMLQKTLTRPGMRYSFEPYGLNERLPQAIETGVYRIAQELVNNVIKHADATEMHVQLLRNKGHLVLMVEDNGRGLPQEHVTDGFGMQGMRDRARLMHGTLAFTSGPEGGTIATLRVPLDIANEA